MTVLAHPSFDLMAYSLENMGVIIKRQTTLTETSTITVTATTQVDDVITSILTSVKVQTSTIYSTVTSVMYENADTTVQVVSTITETPVSTPSVSTPTVVVTQPGASGTSVSDSKNSDTPNSSTGGGDGLSTGEKIGIGVGAGAGAIIIFGLLFFLWRRQKKSKDAQTSIRPDSPSTGAVVGGLSSEKDSYYANGPHQRESYLSSHTNRTSTHSYQAVPTTHPRERGMAGGYGSPERPVEMPDTRGFGYAPYELYDEGPQELYSQNHHENLGLHEAR